MKLTKRQRAALNDVAWGTYWFGSSGTGGDTTRRRLCRLSELGLVKSAGLVGLVDGDGFQLYTKRGLERSGEGWEITDAGIGECDEYWREKLTKEGRGPR